MSCQLAYRSRLRDTAPPKRIQAVTHGHPLRAEMERFIKRRFRQVYGAEIREFYPVLLALRGEAERLLAVAGIRSGDLGALYSEHYLDQPVNVTLSRHYAEPVERESIVEIGNLSPAHLGQSRWLILTLCRCLHQQGFRKVVFTAVPVLANALRRMGLSPILLGDANPSRLPETDKNDWGSYYEKGPRVYAGDLAEGLACLNREPSSVSPKLEART